MKPFGMRYLKAPGNPVEPLPSDVGYDPQLQVLVTSEGNPWVNSDRPGPETRSTTPQDGNKKPEDEGTDMF